MSDAQTTKYYQLVKCIVIVGGADRVEADLAAKGIEVANLRKPTEIHSATLNQESSYQFAGRADQLIRLNCFVFVTFEVHIAVLEDTIAELAKLKYIQAPFLAGTPHELEPEA